VILENPRQAHRYKGQCL